MPTRDYAFTVVPVLPADPGQRTRLARALAPFGTPVWFGPAASYLISAPMLRAGLDGDPDLSGTLAERLAAYEALRDERLAEVGPIALVVAVRGPRAQLGPRHHEALAALDQVVALVSAFYATEELRALLDPRAYRRRNGNTSPGKLMVDVLQAVLPRAKALDGLDRATREALVAGIDGALGFSATTDRQLLGVRAVLTNAPVEVPEAVRAAFDKHARGQAWPPW